MRDRQKKPECIFLDTNIYILGASDPHSAEGQVLTWLGFEERRLDAPMVLISQALVAQILRVARRLRGKDWGGEIVYQLWQNLRLGYVLLPEAGELKRLSRDLAWLPREDLEVYWTAKLGGADCFVSANYKLIRALVAETQDFVCLTPEEFGDRQAIWDEGDR